MKIKNLIIVLLLPLTLAACMSDSELYYHFTSNSSSDPYIIFGDQHGNTQHSSSDSFYLNRTFDVNIDEKNLDKCIAYRTQKIQIYDAKPAQFIGNAVQTLTIRTPTTPIAIIGHISLAAVHATYFCKVRPFTFTPEMNSTYSIDIFTANPKPILRSTLLGARPMILPSDYMESCHVNVEKVQVDGSRAPVAIRYLPPCD